MKRTAWMMAAGVLLGNGLTACGGDGGNTEEQQESNPNPEEQERSVDEPVASTPDANAVASVAGGWCAKPTIEEASLEFLDKEIFVTRFAELSKSWLTPLHDSMFGLQEQTFMEAMTETVAGTFATQCRTTEDWDLLPPEELADPTEQEEFRQEIVDFFADAIEVSTGEQLRLSYHQCTSCGEAVGEFPWFINARLTSSGYLIMEVEFEEGQTASRSIILGPDVAAVQTSLGPTLDWAGRASEDFRTEDATPPVGSGVVTQIMQKDAAGSVSLTFGLADGAITADPGTQDEIRFVSQAECMGFSMQMAPVEVGSQVAIHAGDFDLTMAGATHCGTWSSCGEKERTGSWNYRGSGLSTVIAQPPSAAGEHFSLGLTTGASSSASVAGDVFASGGLGPAGSGGSVELGVTPDQAGDYVVTFSPKLDLGGAIAISNFSDEYRAELPDWLADEVFDLTFGGDSVGSIRVPLRELCPEDVYPKPEVARRMVHVESGSGSMLVGGGRELQAEAGQCISKSQADSSSFTRISDWWEAGIACE